MVCCDGMLFTSPDYVVSYGALVCSMMRVLSLRGIKASSGNAVSRCKY